MRLTVFYLFFAVVASAANLGTQAAAARYIPAVLEPWLSMLVGTAIGLVVKYALDKRFIFQAGHLRRTSEIARSFSLYSLSGVFTTALFWGAELAFFHGFPNWPAARFAGGALGLAIGYVLKYQLDRRFAFA